MVQSGEELECESIRICCYGSSASKTPDRYLSEAHSLGCALAKRGHTCINGAGSYGCMGSLNAGVREGNGNVVGVIHKMFLVDGGDWMDGSSRVFRGGKEQEGYTGNAELLMADGCDLQQRKKMLFSSADAVIVLPGGTGTFDELWEIACLRSLGLVDLPIVCVNVDGYYDSFVTMLQRAYDDELLYKQPYDIVHFETTSALALRWIEAEISKIRKNKANESTFGDRTLRLRERTSILSKGFSMLSSTRVSRFVSSVINKYGANASEEQIRSNSIPLLLAFIGGVVVGVKTAGRRSF